MKLYEYYESLEQPVAKLFQEMSNRGILIDLVYLRQLKDTLERQKEPIECRIKNELGPLNLNSPKQLLEALNDKEIYPRYRGKPSVDKRALATLQCPIVSDLLEYSQLETLLSSFIVPYLERGTSVIHPFFNQCGTRTGRLSCSNPNLLQIPKHTENGNLVRKMFITRPGMLLGDCDFGQIEPRILAHFSKDENLCRMFNAGFDFHQFTADKLAISRERAKVLNLSVGYRATYKSVSQQLKCGEREAQNEIDKWWSLFPSLRRWQDTLIYDTKRSGTCRTLFGRQIKIEGLTEYNTWKREAAERQLINNITQGSAAEIMKLAMISVKNHDECLSRDFGILVQVYDELLCESSNMDNDIINVKRFMEDCVPLEVPLVVQSSVGKVWGETK